MTLPGLNEVFASLLGAMRLFRRDPGGLNDFKLTEDGFWGSFVAIALVVPMSVFAALAFQEAEGAANVSRGALASRTAVNLVLQWVSFVFLMHLFTQMLDLQARFMAFITVYNWCSVLGTGFMMIPVLMFTAGMISVEFALVLIFFLFLVMLSYFWYVAKEALQATGLVAAGIVGLDFLLNLTIERMFGL